MSRTDDYGWTDTHPENQRPDAGPSVVDRLAELPSRLGLSREAARREMERFRGVAEYDLWPTQRTPAAGRARVPKKIKAQGHPLLTIGCWASRFAEGELRARAHLTDCGDEAAIAR